LPSGRLEDLDEPGGVGLEIIDAVAAVEGQAASGVVSAWSQPAKNSRTVASSIASRASRMTVVVMVLVLL
jgi:hypothetical protein